MIDAGHDGLKPPDGDDPNGKQNGQAGGKPPRDADASDQAVFNPEADCRSIRRPLCAVEEKFIPVEELCGALRAKYEFFRAKAIEFGRHASRIFRENAKIKEDLDTSKAKSTQLDARTSALEARASQVEEKSALLEKMFFNGVNILTVAIVALATAGVIYRQLDQKSVEEKQKEVFAQTNKDVTKRMNDLSQQWNTASESIKKRLEEIAETPTRVDILETGLLQLMVKDYETALREITLVSADEESKPAISQNLLILRKKNSIPSKRPDSSGTFLCAVSEALLDYYDYLDGPGEPEKLKSAIDLLEKSQREYSDKVDNAILFRHFPAYLANFEGVLKLKEFLDQPRPRTTKSLDEARTLFLKAQSLDGNFYRPYGNQAMVMIHLLKLPEYEPLFDRSDSAKQVDPAKLEDLARKAQEFVDQANDELAKAPYQGATPRCRAVHFNNCAHVLLVKAYLSHVLKKNPTVIEKLLKAAQNRATEANEQMGTPPTVSITQAEIACVRLLLEEDEWRSRRKTTQQRSEQAEAIIAIVQRAVNRGYKGFRHLTRASFPREKEFLSLIRILDEDGNKEHWERLLSVAGVK